jgi:formate hydrogenlyase subunit 6/NADH:ubiquinone oxidoreductase subunit I
VTWIPDSFGSLQLVLSRMVSRRQPRVVTATGLYGTPRLTRTAAGAPRCVACALCAGACPSLCIIVEAGPPLPGTDGEEWARGPSRFELDLASCLRCGLCEAACPVGAIVLIAQPPEPSTAEVEHLRLDLTTIMVGASDTVPA